MSVHLWLAFAVASLVAGMAVGNIVAMSLSPAGVGALLAASALAFTMLKWVGALYLIGLGLVTILRSRNTPDDAKPPRATSPRAAFAGNLAVATFHPKTIMFFVAFAPQFIRPGSDDASQAMILVLTFGVVVGCTDTIYAIGAAGLATASAHD